MFGLTAYSRLYFKVNDSNHEDYSAAGTQPLVYSRQGKEAMSYYELPEAIYRDAALS